MLEALSLYEATRPSFEDLVSGIKTFDSSRDRGGNEEQSQNVMPGISVIIPAHNSAGTIGVAVYSITKQKFRGDYEIIIVNDGSSDATQSEIEAVTPHSIEADTSMKIVTLKRNCGSSVARNIALAHARYDTILPFDADDMLVPPEESPGGIGFMQRAYDILVSNKNADVVFSDIQNFGALASTQVFPEFDMKTFLEKCTIWTPGMHRRETALAMGGWDTSLSYVQDFAYWAKMYEYKEARGEEFKAIRIPEPLYLYRRYPINDNAHESAATNNNHRLGWQAMIERFPDLYEKHFPDIPLNELPTYFHRNEINEQRK